MKSSQSNEAFALRTTPVDVDEFSRLLFRSFRLFRNRSSA
jgi:hypothetical protein